MTPPLPRWPEIKAVFEAVAELPPARREPVIAAAALDEASLAELRSLLAHHAQASAGSAFMATPAALPLPGSAARIGQRVGAWEVVRAVGAGGMGEVFEARRADGSFEGRAAIKLLKRGMDSAAVLQRFAQERQALARLSHPHIARLLDAGASEDGLPYFVLEYVDGRPLDEAARGLALPDRLALFLQLADAVSYAHRNLLVHRDLKPGNVLVDTEGQVKLLDFGIAKALDPLESADGHTTVGGARPYTPHYASPEQVRGEPVSTATDIYSLGVLLYQMLTGTRPTGRHASTPAEAARSVLEDEPTRPSRLLPTEALDPQWLHTRRKLEGDLDNILLKALEKLPERRYASVDAMAADVRANLQGRPVSARPATVAYVWAKFVRRNRWPVLAAALGGVGLASGLAAALLQERQAAALGVLGLAGGLGLALFQGRQAALSRDEARRQLAGVKDITTELVFRYGDAIQQLPGGAAAQEAMLKQTVASLDVTLKIAPDDVDLLVLVASALGRLAQIQGNPTFAGPERAREAQATVARALALGGQVWAAKRADVRFVNQHLITLLTQANMRRNAGQPAEGLTVLETAAERAAETLAERLNDADRASVLELRANVLTNMAHFNHHSGRPSLGRPQEALRHYGQAEAEFRALYGNPALRAAMNRATEPGSPSAEEWANHNLGNVCTGRAVVHQRLGDFAAMKRELQAALLLRQDNLRRNPTSAIWRQSLMFDSNYLAAALLGLGEHAAALVASQQAWDIVAERRREEGGQALWAATQGNFAVQHARALADNGRMAEALPVFELALQRTGQLRAEADTPELQQREAELRAAHAQALAGV
jgi:tetratricopeptide (TPR) repeat protein